MSQPPPARPPRLRVGTRTSSGWVLGSVGRTPVVLAPSWLLIAAVLAVLVHPTVASLVAGAAVAALTTLGFVAMLFVSVLVHELAHGLTAQRAGARPHEYVITFWGGHTSFDRELPTPGSSAWVSAAGPLANVVLAVAAWAATSALVVPVPVWLLLWGAMISNGFVGAFNLLPGSPLDGGRVLEAAVWRVTGDRLRGTIAAAWGGRVIVVALVLAFLGWPLVQGRQPSLTTVVWVALLGSMLWSGAGQALQQARAQRAVTGLDLRHLADPAVVLRADAMLTDADQLLRERPGHVVVLAGPDGAAAVLDHAAAAAVPPAARAGTPLHAVARRLPPSAVVTELVGPAAVAAVGRARRAGPTAVLVTAGRVAGVLDIDRLLAELDRRGPRRRR